ncbi:MAG: carbonate dehydratase [Limnobacter sp.]|uniref:carbonate dehydratase n=1 Tax=Limnobacter sp. TaxID=2003368 RepID=UPI003919C7DB
MTTSLQHLLDANAEWATAQVDRDPEFFKRLENQQSPEYFWIGCSDSRVPANTIVNLQPGEVFVHRNVANQVFHGDLNCQSATQFAVEILKVKHIIVCGHYGCSGVRIAMRGDRVGLADAWVRPIHQLARHHGLVPAEGSDEKPCLDALCELNVIEQVKRLSESTLIEDAWDRGQDLTIHGWIYSLKDGLVRNLNMSVAGRDTIEPVYTNAVNELKKRYR